MTQRNDQEAQQAIKDAILGVAQSLDIFKEMKDTLIMGFENLMKPVLEQNEATIKNMQKAGVTFGQTDPSLAKAQAQAFTSNIETLVERNAAAKKVVQQAAVSLGTPIPSDAEVQAKKYAAQIQSLAETNHEVSKMAITMAALGVDNVKIDAGLAKKIKSSQERILGQLHQINEIAQHAQKLMQTQTMLLGSGGTLSKVQQQALDSSLKQLSQLNLDLKSEVKAQQTNVSHFRPR